MQQEEKEEDSFGRWLCTRPNAMNTDFSKRNINEIHSHYTSYLVLQVMYWRNHAPLTAVVYGIPSFPLRRYGFIIVTQLCPLKLAAATNPPSRTRKKVDHKNEGWVTQNKKR